MKRSEVLEAGKVWVNRLGFIERDQMFREGLKRGMPFVDYELGIETDWNKFRYKTQLILALLLQEKGKLPFSISEAA